MFHCIVSLESKLYCPLTILSVYQCIGGTSTRCPAYKVLDAIYNIARNNLHNTDLWNVYASVFINCLHETIGM